MSRGTSSGTTATVIPSDIDSDSNLDMEEVDRSLKRRFKVLGRRLMRTNARAQKIYDKFSHNLKMNNLFGEPPRKTAKRGNGTEKNVRKIIKVQGSPSESVASKSDSDVTEVSMKYVELPTPLLLGLGDPEPEQICSEPIDPKPVDPKPIDLEKFEAGSGVSSPIIVLETINISDSDSDPEENGSETSGSQTQPKVVIF